MISPSQRPLPDNTQHSQQTNIHAPVGIRTHNLSRRAAVDLRLRPHGHWDRHHHNYDHHICLVISPVTNYHHGHRHCQKRKRIIFITNMNIIKVYVLRPDPLKPNVIVLSVFSRFSHVPRSPRLVYKDQLRHNISVHSFPASSPAFRMPLCTF